MPCAAHSGLRQVSITDPSTTASQSAYQKHTQGPRSACCLRVRNTHGAHTIGNQSQLTLEGPGKYTVTDVTPASVTGLTSKLFPGGYQ